MRPSYSVFLRTSSSDTSTKHGAAQSSGDTGMNSETFSRPGKSTPESAKLHISAEVVALLEFERPGGARNWIPFVRYDAVGLC